ncbi:MAG: tRNA uridine(34) 5-carboxymethylaminomethyl modification radical SAM/GNAT enzyme Elp3 [Thermoplasmatota archaeon]
MKEKNAGAHPPKPDSWKGDPDLEEAVSELVEMLLSGKIRTREELQREKVRVLKDRKTKEVPANSVILDFIRYFYPDNENELIGLLKKKPSRTLSGVAVVAVMTSPSACPHGKCIFCPGGVDQEVPTPQSYTGREPAAMRAKQNDFDPERQVARRIRQLLDIGHDADKIDLILMGGTITAREVDYQYDFVKGCFDGMNGDRSRDLREAHERNEKSAHRCIGMTFETRPDHLGRKECDLVLELGGTRIELGVQSLFDLPLIKSQRGHEVKDSMDSTRLAKDTGLKVGYHMMPGMPGSTKEMDAGTAWKAFNEDEFKPDMIKIYPTLVIKGTSLHEMWLQGEYEPLSTEDAAELVAEMKRMTPPWVRIQRVQRDIPSPLVEEGVKKSNLRQLSQLIMEKRGWTCRCIRCREIGHRMEKGAELPTREDVSLSRREYEASGGKEVFLSFEVETEDSLIGFVRLRKPSDTAYRKEMEGSGIVRELKVFGPLVPIGRAAEEEWQHRGYGRELLAYAGSIVKDEWGLERILVTSGVGAREYYRKLGYERIGPYMGKKL